MTWQLFQEIEHAFEVLPLVINAGAALYKPFTDLTEEDFDPSICAECQRNLYRRGCPPWGEGALPSFISTLGYVGAPYGSVYISNLKVRAVNQFVRSLAHS